MTATLTRPAKTTRKPAPAKSRSCRWVYDAQSSARLLEDGIPCPLAITIGTDSWTYLVERDGAGWKLTHVMQDEAGCEVYYTDLRHGTCTCKAKQYRRIDCKHILAVRAALNAIGVQS